MLSIWFKIRLNFLLVWFRVASGLGQWFIAGWLKVGAKFYLKSVQGLIRNLLKTHLPFRFGFGFVLGWVNPLFGISFEGLFNSRLVETLKLAGGLTLRCVCVCSFVREGFMVYDCLSIYIYIHRQFALRCSLGLD